MENMIKTHALFQLLSDVRFLTNIFIYVKHGRVLRPGIAHETGTPPSCRNSKLTMTPTSSIVQGKDCNWPFKGRTVLDLAGNAVPDFEGKTVPGFVAARTPL